MTIDELVIQAQMDAVNHLNIDRLDDIEGRYNFKGITRHDANLLIQAVRGLHLIRRELEERIAKHELLETCLADARQTVARQAVTIGQYQTALRAKNFEASTMQSNEVNHWVEVCDGLRDELHDIKAQCDQLRQANATIPSLEAELAAAKQAVLDAFEENAK